MNDSFLDRCLEVLLPPVCVFVAMLMLTMPFIIWKSAATNAEIWNRCFPGSEITTFEAFWSGVRIDQCPIQEIVK